MSNLIELAAERLMKLEPDIRAALGAEPNEADTRLKVLDRFLFELLDWQRDSSVLTEPPTESGYIDYLLRVGENTNAMVVEAKRQGKLQPATKSSEVMHVNLSGPVVKPLLPGIKQAMSYALEQGVPVACVTDGNTWFPEIKIDEIIKSKFGGPSITADRHRTHRALLKGEYDRFSEAENEFVSNLFYTNPMRPESPLLAFYLLWILRQRLNSVRDEGVESKHWHASELCAVFEGCGVADELVTQVLNRLYERRLIEALDPNVKHIGVGDRVAIKDSGLAHIELVLNSPTYVEQTALTTGVNELFTRDEMRRNNYPQKMEDVRNAFVRYLLKIDAGRVTIPTSKVYDQIGLARRQIERMIPPKRSRAPVKWGSQSPPSM